MHKQIARLVLFLIIILFMLKSHALAFDGILGTTDSFEPEGRVVISKGFNFGKKNVALSFEWNTTYNHIFLQHLLTEELITNGFTVIERLQFERILREISLDQTGVVKQKDSATKDSTNKETPTPTQKTSTKEDVNKDTTEKDKPVTELSRSDLKKLGEILGISHLLFFGLTPDENLYFRIINLETAEIEVCGNITTRKNQSILNLSVARSIVKAITASQTLKTPVKELFIVYLQSSYDESKLKEKTGAKQILYNDEIEKFHTVIYIDK